MKKIVLLISVFAAFVACATSQKSTLTKDVFFKNVEEKVANMQELIGFNDQQAEQLKTLELKFLLDVQKAENCCLCNSAKKIAKLQENRKTALQKVLERDEYIKYRAIEDERIQKQPLMAK